MLAALAIANYRSLRDVVLPLAPLNIVTGPNGSGKSSVYRALRLLTEVAQGGAVASLAREGGLKRAAIFRAKKMQYWASKSVSWAAKELSL